MPNEEEDPELHALVAGLQIHDHRKTCQTGKGPTKFTAAHDDLTPEQREAEAADQRCRFHFPRPAQDATLLTIPESLQAHLNEAEDISLATIAAIVEKMEEEGRSAEETAEAVEKQEKAYALERLQLLQSNSLELSLKRGEADTRVNNYNSAVLRLWQANMDIQYVTNTYAAIMYIAGKAH